MTARLPQTPLLAAEAVDPSSGLLRDAVYRPSPNCDDRPEGAAIDLLVVHCISLPAGEFGGPWVDALFTNTLDPQAHASFADLEGLRVSAHLVIHRDGAAVQYVPFHRRAWHAGVSCYGARERCNDFSIGIELEGVDTVPYTPAQYQRLARVTAALLRTYPSLTPECIAGHCDIAPGRKTDPGPAFEWDRFRRLLQDACAV